MFCHLPRNRYLCSRGKNPFGGSSNILKYCLRHAIKVRPEECFNIYCLFYFPDSLLYVIGNAYLCPRKRTGNDSPTDAGSNNRYHERKQFFSSGWTILWKNPFCVLQTGSINACDRLNEDGSKQAYMPTNKT